MKILPIISIMLIGTIAVVNAISEAELKVIIDNMLRKIRRSADFINYIKYDLTNVMPNLDKAKNSMEFRIPENQKIIEIQNKLNNHKYDSNITTCINLKKHSVEVLKKELRNILYNKVKLQVQMIDVSVNYVAQSLADILELLHNPKLEIEIKHCLTDEKLCKITNGYRLRIQRLELTLQTITTAVSSIIDHTLDKYIYPILPEKIISGIYVPVNNCLSNLQY